MTSVSAFQTFARLGFAGRGLMYLMIGGLALGASRATDPVGLLGTLSGVAGGRISLLLLAAGLFCYGLWRLVETMLDLEGHGDGAAGKAVRAGHLTSAVLHIGLSLYAVHLAVPARGACEAGGPRRAAGMVLDLPGGQLILAAASAVLATAGVYQLVTAWRLGFLRGLLPEARTRAWIRWAGRLGYAARGLIFLMAAWFLWNAARTADPGEAGGMAEALRALGPTEFLLAAAGLVLFGLFGLVEAGWRRVETPPPI